MRPRYRGRAGPATGPAAARRSVCTARTSRGVHGIGRVIRLRRVEMWRDRWDEAAGRHRAWWPKPHNGARGRVPQKVEASHGAYGHRRTQSGKPDLHPDRERGDHRTPHPHAAGAVRCSVRRESADEDPHRVIDRERVGGKVPRGTRARGGGCRLHPRAFRRDPFSVGRTHPVREARARRGDNSGFHGKGRGGQSSLSRFGSEACVWFPRARGKPDGYARS